METNNKNNIGLSIFLFILAIALLFFAIKQENDSEKTKKDLSKEISQQVISDVKKDLPESSEYSDFSSLKNLKKLEIVKDFPSWTPNSKIENNKVVTKIILNKGDIAKGYLYVKVSINNEALSSWESIYLKMNNIGGHLFRPKSLKIPNSEKTELLFSLNDFYYLDSAPYSENRIPSEGEWFSLFKNGKEIEITSFISSLKPANIDEISLYYDCTIDSDCSINIK